jgi:integrase
MRLTKNKSGIYEVTFKTEHGSKTVSTHCRNKPDAERVVKHARIKEIEMAAMAGALNAAAISLGTTGKQTKMEQLAKEFVDWRKTVRHSRHTCHNAEVILNAFMEHGDGGLRSATPQSVTEQHVDAYVNDPNSKASARSRSMRRSNITAFFNWATSKGYCNHNPAKLVPVDMSALSHEQKEPKPKLSFTNEEVDRLLAMTHPEEGTCKVNAAWWFFAVSVGRYTGLRLGDIAQMEWKSWQFNEEEPGVVVWTEKRDRRVKLKFSDLGDVAYKRLRLAYINVSSRQLSSDCKMFPKEAELACDVRRRSILSKHFRQLLDEAGIKGKSFHSFRRTFVTDARRKGIPMEHIAAQVGHVSVNTTKGYVAPATAPKRRFT